ncbi:hypothetical protein PoB_004754600 [Plakobranchus ocellatus]|uniref:Uncharacterized protein n=1 Tax=Plakobranchus ocellatus TaxID=259542 RepID=A0AAV4BCF1_9GAST|nr:hypothetical protein PoB_004754600 [Plakobranchus ocellatus]
MRAGHSQHKSASNLTPAVAQMTSSSKTLETYPRTIRLPSAERRNLKDHHWKVRQPERMESQTHHDDALSFRDMGFMLTWIMAPPKQGRLRNTFKSFVNANLMWPDFEARALQVNFLLQTEQTRAEKPTFNTYAFEVDPEREHVQRAKVETTSLSHLPVTGDLCPGCNKVCSCALGLQSHIRVIPRCSYNNKVTLVGSETISFCCA